MLDPAFVRDYQQDVRRALRSRGVDADAELERFATLETLRRRLIPELEGLKREQNTAGEDVARAKREGRDASGIVEASRQRSQRIRQLGIDLEAVEQERNALLMSMPNVPHASVPLGTRAAENVEVRRWQEPRQFDFAPQPHWDIGPALGILDFERAARMSGARFSVLMGAGARMSRALINLMLDLHTREHGYTEVEPPFLVGRAALEGTGNLPKFEADLFKVAGDWDLFLVLNRRVPLANLNRTEICSPTLPFALQPTPASGREAGSSAPMCAG